MNKETPKTTANTLGNIAKNYGVGISILKDWINSFPELEKEIDLYCQHVSKNKASKLLPPLLVEKIYNTLGKP